MAEPIWPEAPSAPRAFSGHLSSYPPTCWGETNEVRSIWSQPDEDPERVLVLPTDPETLGETVAGVALLSGIPAAVVRTVLLALVQFATPAPLTHRNGDR